MSVQPEPDPSELLAADLQRITLPGLGRASEQRPANQVAEGSGVRRAVRPAKPLSLVRDGAMRV